MAEQREHRDYTRRQSVLVNAELLEIDSARLPEAPAAGDREVIADAMTDLAALPCTPEGLLLRNRVTTAGGLESVKTTLLTAHGDVRLQCKAVNALTSLCMSEEVAKGFAGSRNSSVVVDRLGDMLRSRSQWAQADAAGCLGWLIGSIHGTALHEILLLVTKLMVKHTTTDDEVFIREEKQRSERKGWDRNRGSGMKGNSQGQVDDDQARERLDNIRVYTLVFLLKASHADPSTMAAMVEAGVIPALLRHLARATGDPLSSQPEQTTKSLKEKSMNTSGLERLNAHHRRDEVASQEESDLSPSSILLAARLLYAFSVNSTLRGALLEAKCLPPLIRLRRRLQRAGKAAGAAACDTVEPEVECAASNSPDKIPNTAVRTGCSVVAKGGTILADRTATQGVGNATAERAYSSCEHGVQGTGEESGQPSLAATIDLIIHEVVGKASPPKVRDT